MMLASLMMVSAVAATGCTAATEGKTAEETKPVLEPDPEPAAVPGISATRPCGAYTTAHVPGAEGQMLTVCVMPSGHELIAVTSDAPDAAPEARPRCALDVFVATAAAGIPVPRALVDSCARKTGTTPVTAGREVVDHAVFVDAPIAPALSPASVGVSGGTKSAYCGASGDSSFQSGECMSCNGFDPSECAAVCVPQLWGTSQRTCPESDVALETVASCGGSTRLRAFWREGSGDAWVTVHDDSILANRFQRVFIVDGDAFADADMRFRAESAAGAGHRHTFRCHDN